MSIEINKESKLSKKEIIIYILIILGLFCFLIFGSAFLN